MKIIPAVYPDLFEEVADKLYALTDITDFVQIVFCDGSYGLRKSWVPTGKEILPTSFDYEADLILTSWKEYLLKVYAMGIKSVVVHIDEFTDNEYEELFKFIYIKKMRLGITVYNDVSVDVLVKAINKIKTSGYFADSHEVFIQVTGMRSFVNNVFSFDERVLSRIRVLKKLFPMHTIQVSGRITPETAAIVKQAGADILVSSSYIFGQQDLQEAINNLLQAVEAAPPEVKLDNNVSGEVVVEKEVKEEKQVKPKEVRVKYEASTNEIIYESDDDLFSKK